MEKIKLCIVTEFVQENFFQWQMALDYRPELEVSSAVMNKTILEAYPLNDSLWNSIREADVVFVYCVRHDLDWEWYKLPLLVKKIMNPKAKMICQFDLEFLWLFYPNHHSWKKEAIWAKDKTPEQFFKETKIMEVADAYIVLVNELLEKYTSKPIYYLPLPQLVRYDSFLKTIPSKKSLRDKSKRVVVLRHSVKSASINQTLKKVIGSSGFPVTIFTTENTDSKGKFKILKTLPQPRKSVVYGNIPRESYMEFLARGYAAIDDNEGYYAWSRFAMECLKPNEKLVTNNGLVPIKDINVNDFVLTHRARLRKVLAKSERTFDGNMIKIKTYGYGEPIVVTPNHPLFVSNVAWKKIHHNDEDIERYRIISNPKWIEAKNIKPNQFILYPVNKDVKDKETVTLSYEKIYDDDPYKRKSRIVNKTIPCNNSFCRLIGYYLSEGSVNIAKSYRNYCVEYSFGEELLLVNDAVRCARELGFNPHIVNTKTATKVIINSKGLATFFRNEFGSGAKNKFIPLWVRYLPYEKLRNVLETYLAGDGCDKTKIFNVATTVSYQLAYGIKEIANKLGFTSSVVKSRDEGEQTIQGRICHCYSSYTIRVYKSHTQKFILNNKNFILLRVKSTGLEPYSGPVYNLQVEEDESYCSFYHTLHNCALAHVPCVGSTRAVKEFFPELYIKPKDYEKQKELLKRLCSDKDFWLKMVSSGKKLVLKKMNTNYLTNEFVRIITSIVPKPPRTILIEKPRKSTPVKSITSEFLEWGKYRSFVKKWKSAHKTIPPRPSKDGSVMDGIHKCILTQMEWDMYYGNWRKFIEGYKPKDFAEVSKIDIAKTSEVSIDNFKRKKPLTSFNTINPILIIWSPRDIAEVRKAFDKIDYVDKVWFKYFSKPSVLRQTKQFMDSHKEYTHLIIVLDDVVCPSDSVKILLEDLLVYDFPVLSGCFNFCNCWATGVRWCTWCQKNQPHPYINITFDPIPKKDIITKRPTRKSYKFVTEEWRKANPIIKQVWFEGFGLAVIRRDIYEKIGFRCWIPAVNHTSDVPWAIDLEKAGIPQFCDFKVKSRHRAFSEDRELLVNKKSPKIIFQPAKSSLIVTSASKIILSPKQKEVLNVLIIIDQYGWAFDFGARGIQKYSKHNCTIKRLDTITPEDIRINDVMFCMCSGQWYSVHHYAENQKAFNTKKPKMRLCIGLRASPKEAEIVYKRRGEHVPKSIPANAIGCISKETYDFTVELEKQMGTHRKVYLTYSAVDTELFHPRKHLHPKKHFVVGWVGNSMRPIKRTHLLSKLNFPVKIKSGWGPEFFKKGRSQKPMADFYHTIDALVNVSLSEGFPQPILEAMASGLPIVSTAVGAMPEVLDNRWLIPSLPESEMLKQMNEKLQKLKDNFKLRRQVGEANRQKALNIWSWKHIVKRYDAMFEGKEI